MARRSPEKIVLRKYQWIVVRVNMFLLVVLRVSQGKVGRVSWKQLTMTRCIPAPDCPVEVNYIDLPNKLCFLALPQVGKVFLDMINQVTAKPPGAMES